MRFGLIENRTPYGHWFCSQNVKCVWIWACDRPQNEQKHDPLYVKRNKLRPGDDVKTFKSNEAAILRELLSNKKIDFLLFGHKNPCYSLFNVCLEMRIGIGWFENNKGFDIKVNLPWRLVRHGLSHSHLGGVTTLQLKWCYCYNSNLVQWFWSHPENGVRERQTN